MYFGLGLGIFAIIVGLVVLKISWREIRHRMVICILNEDYPANIEKRKVYMVITDKPAERDGFLRIYDENGKDYLYPKDLFVEFSLSSKKTNKLEGYIYEKCDRPRSSND